MMADQQIILWIASTLSQARDGVVYDTKAGAACPACGKRLRVMVTKPWLGNSRLRYHKCNNPKCVLHQLGETVRSWQDL